MARKSATLDQVSEYDPYRPRAVRTRLQREAADRDERRAQIDRRWAKKRGRVELDEGYRAWVDRF